MLRLACLVAAALLAVLVAVPPRARAEGRPDCSEVLRAYHRISGHDGAHVPDPERIASKLGVDADYVERCALAYGRRVKRVKTPGVEEQADEDLSAKREAEEFEEIGREERGEVAKVVPVNPQEDDQKLRNQLRNYDDETEEWQPYLTHEWEPDTGHEWKPFLLDDDEE